MRCTSIVIGFLIAFGQSIASAAVTIHATPAATLGLPGFTTWTVTAVSDDPITAVDFVGNGSSDPATARGFLGVMNQISLPVPTIFNDNNLIIPVLSPGATALQDSQFSVTSTAVVVPPGLAEESTSLLQAAWAWPTAVGTSVPIAQLVVRGLGSINYRGAITALVNGIHTDFPVSGVIASLPILPPVVVDANLGPITPGTTVIHQFVASEYTPLITWGSLVTGPTPVPHHPTLSAGGEFVWNTDGTAPGTYTFNVTATNPAGLDVGRLTVTLVPEPGTCALAAFATALLTVCRQW